MRRIYTNPSSKVMRDSPSLPHDVQLGKNNRRLIVGSRVGIPWPELNQRDVHWPDANSASIHYTSAKTKSNSFHSLAFRFSIKTRIFVLVLLGGIATYAMLTDNSALLKDIVHVIGDSIGEKTAVGSSP